MKRVTLTKQNSTRAERVFAQALRELRVPFEHRVDIGFREVDFLVGKYCFEIDGHNQDYTKNAELIRLGYSPIHLSNQQLKDVNELKKWLQILLTKQGTSSQMQMEISS